MLAKRRAGWAMLARAFSVAMVRTAESAVSLRDRGPVPSMHSRPGAAEPFMVEPSVLRLAPAGHGGLPVQVQAGGFDW
nr:hypothetical protein GCM10020063_041220 [Dactylosporangium thailandense]